VISQIPNKWFLRYRLNCPKLEFNKRGPATAKLLSPNLLWVRVELLVYAPIRAILRYVYPFRSLVCLCVGPTVELCINGWTDRDAVWRAESCGSNKHVLDWGEGRKNPFAASRGDKTAMRLFAKLLQTLVSYVGVRARQPNLKTITTCYWSVLLRYLLTTTII